MKKYLVIVAALALLCSCKPADPEFEKSISGSWYGVGMTGISNELITESAESGLAQMIDESVDLLDDFWWNFGDGKASLKPGARPAASGTYKMDGGPFVTVAYPSGKIRYWICPGDFGEWEGEGNVARALYLIEMHNDAQGNPMTVQTAYKLVRTGLEPSWEQ